MYGWANSSLYRVFRLWKTHFYVLMGYHLNKKRTEEEIPYFEATGYCEDTDGKVLSFHDLLGILSSDRKLLPTKTLRGSACKLLVRVKFLKPSTRVFKRANNAFARSQW